MADFRSLLYMKIWPLSWITDSSYIWYCHAEMCSSVVWRFLSSILVFDYKSDLQSISKGNNYSSLPSVNRYETRLVVLFWKRVPVFCIVLLPLQSQQCVFFGYFESGGFFSFYLIMERTHNALHERRALTVDLWQRLLYLYLKRTLIHWKGGKCWLVITLQISDYHFCAPLELYCRLSYRNLSESKHCHFAPQQQENSLITWFLDFRFLHEETGLL